AFLHARIIDIAQPDLGDLGMIHFLLDGRIEALKLDVELNERLTLENRLHRRFWVLQGVNQPLVHGTQKAADRLGVFIDELAGHDNGVGVEIHPVIAVVYPAHLLARIDAHELGTKKDGVDVSKYAVDLSAHEHLLPQVGRKGGDVDLRGVEPGDLGKRGKELERAVVRGSPEGAAFEVFWRLDRTIGLHRHREGWTVVHHIDRERCFLRLFRRELDQRVDVAKTDVVRAGCALWNGGGRAIALIDGDVEPLSLVVALVFGNEEPALRALIFPIQHEFELGLGAGLIAGEACEADCGYHQYEQMPTQRMEGHWRAPHDHAGATVL